jgi:hypothetical protein
LAQPLKDISRQDLQDEQDFSFLQHADKRCSNFHPSWHNPENPVNPVQPLKTFLARIYRMNRIFLFSSMLARGAATFIRPGIILEILLILSKL